MSNYKQIICKQNVSFVIGVGNKLIETIKLGVCLLIELDMTCYVLL